MYFSQNHAGHVYFRVFQITLSSVHFKMSFMSDLVYDLTVIYIGIFNGRKWQRKSLLSRNIREGLRRSSVVECLRSIHEALGLTPITRKEGRKVKKEKERAEIQVNRSYLHIPGILTSS